MEQKEENKQKKEGTLGNLLYNIGIPVSLLFLLPKLLEKWTELAPKEAGKVSLVAALAFPIAYFLYHYIKEKRKSVMAIVGAIGVLFTGLVGIMELPREYIAIERAAIPLIFALVIIASNYTKSPIVKKMLHNPMVFNTEKIDALIAENKAEKEFEETQKHTSYILACTFLLSSTCNYFITRHYMADLTMPFTEAYAKVKTMSIFITIAPLLLMTVAAIFFYQKRLVKHTGVKDAEKLYADELKDK